MILQFPDRKGNRRSTTEPPEESLSWVRQLRIVEHLPFVGREGPPDGRSNFPTRNYWTDEPTGEGHVDYQRGQRSEA